MVAFLIGRFPAVMITVDTCGQQCGGAGGSQNLKRVQTCRYRRDKGGSIPGTAAAALLGAAAIYGSADLESRLHVDKQINGLQDAVVCAIHRRILRPSVWVVIVVPAGKYKFQIFCQQG